MLAEILVERKDGKISRVIQRSLVLSGEELLHVSNPCKDGEGLTSVCDGD